LDERFKDVPIYSGTELYKFVSNIHSIADSSVIDKDEITGIVSVSVLIDKEGNVEATYITESINSQIDSLVVSAIFNSNFKKMMGANGQITKYIINVTHVFYNGTVLNPLVNGNSFSDDYKEIPISLNNSTPIIAEDNIKPSLLHKASPTYSDRARRAGAQGRVLVGVEIKENGHIGSMEIIRSDNNLLIVSSLEAASRCRFKPAVSKGKKVMVKMSIPFDYRLN
jgi:protein TonB